MSSSLFPSHSLSLSFLSAFFVPRDHQTPYLSIDVPQDIELLKSDVASFASSIGLSSQISSQPHPKEIRKFPTEKDEKKKKNDQQVKARVPHVSVNHSKPIDRWKNLPNLSLMKASSLEVWYVDATELEAKVM